MAPWAETDAYVHGPAARNNRKRSLLTKHPKEITAKLLQAHLHSLSHFRINQRSYESIEITWGARPVRWDGLPLLDIIRVEEADTLVVPHDP